MKLSDVIVQMWSLATDSPKFQDVKKTEDGKEMIKVFKLLYKEVLAVEAEGEDFDVE